MKKNCNGVLTSKVSMKLLFSEWNSILIRCSEIHTLYFLQFTAQQDIIWGSNGSGTYRVGLSPSLGHLVIAELSGSMMDVWMCVQIHESQRPVLPLKVGRWRGVAGRWGWYGLWAIAVIGAMGTESIPLKCFKEGSTLLWTVDSASHSTELLSAFTEGLKVQAVLED